jgi:hypothetical protein
MNKPPILNIRMVPAGIELVLAGLNKLPREQSEPLYQEILGQYAHQMQEIKTLEAVEPDSTPDC